MIHAQGGDFIRDLLNVEVVATLNLAFCNLHHLKHCSDQTYMNAECAKVASFLGAYMLHVGEAVPQLTRTDDRSAWGARSRMLALSRHWRTLRSLACPHAGLLLHAAELAGPTVRMCCSQTGLLRACDCRDENVSMFFLYMPLGR